MRIYFSKEIVLEAIKEINRQRIESFKDANREPKDFDWNTGVSEGLREAYQIFEAYLLIPPEGLREKAELYDVCIDFAGPIEQSPK